MAQETSGGGELRLSWSARGLAYVLGKHGLTGLCPVPAADDDGAVAAAAARVELRVVGAEVKQVRWVTTAGPPSAPRQAPPGG